MRFVMVPVTLLRICFSPISASLSISQAPHQRQLVLVNVHICPSKSVNLPGLWHVIETSEPGQQLPGILFVTYSVMGEV